MACPGIALGCAANGIAPIVELPSVALVVFSPGSSAGIGWAVCEVLAGAGMRVVAVARRRDRLEQLQQALVGQGVPIADFLPIVCDITKVPLLTEMKFDVLYKYIR